MRNITIFGVALRVLFYSVDFLDAQAAKQIAHKIKHRGWNIGKDNTHWHLTWWGLSYYADKQGLKQLALNQTIPKKGDIISVHNIDELVKDLKMHKELGLELLETVNVGDGFPSWFTGCDKKETKQPFSLKAKRVVLSSMHTAKNH